MPTSLLRAGPLAADFVSGTNRPTFAVRNGHRVAVFPQAGTTETFYTFNMPTVYASGDVDVILTWMAGVATSGDCVWEVAFERHEPGVDDLDTPSFATGVTFVATADPVTGVTIKTVITISSAQMDSVSQGDQFRLAVRRLGDDSSQTMVGTAELMTVVIDQDAAPAGGGGGGFWEDGVGTRAGIGKGVPGPLAAGIESLAHGSSASAAGDRSWGFHGNAGFADTIAHGVSSIARSAEAMAIGPRADAGFGIAMGPDAFVHATYGTNGIAIGSGARSEVPDHICIGNGFTGIPSAVNTDLITIGRGHTITDNNGNYAGRDTIIIGTSNLTDGSKNTIIGHRAYVGGRHNIVIANYFLHPAGGGVAENFGWFNVILKGNDSNRTAIDNDGTGNPNHYGNIVVVSGGSRAGLRGYNATNGRNQNYNTFLGQGDSYIYSSARENILIGGQGCQLGDLNNATAHMYKNVVIGHGNRGGHAGSGEQKYMVIIGANNNITALSTYLYGGITIGKGNYVYNTSFAYMPIAIGQGNGATGEANIAMGYGCRTYRTAAATYGFFKGNLAIGFKCYSSPATDVPWRGTIAQGVGTRCWVGGHRAFSADTNNTSTKPNQAGWVTTQIETTDATQTTVLTFPTEADKAYSVWGFAVARRTDVNGFNAVFGLTNTLVYRDAAGAPVLVGAPKAWTLDSNQGAPAWGIDVTIVANDIVVRVTGTAAQTIEWLAETHILEVRG